MSNNHATAARSGTGPSRPTTGPGTGSAATRAVPPQRNPGEPRAALRSDRLIQMSPTNTIWALEESGVGLLFRGRINAGALRLPAHGSPSSPSGVTLGYASAPLVLHSVGGSFTVGASVPWAVPSSGEWRISLSQVADLRLVHTSGKAIELPTLSRPIRFEEPASTFVRAAIQNATPIWVDQQLRQVEDLAAPRLSEGVRPIRRGGGDRLRERDGVAAFRLLVSWALQQHAAAVDPQLALVTGFIDAHLSDPGLTTNMIAARTGLSRRTLQAMFSPQGGVAAFIRRRRLEAALHRLTAPAEEGADLDAVAAVVGLGSRRTLERAMRQVYGLTPRQARSRVLAGVPLRAIEPSTRPPASG